MNQLTEQTRTCINRFLGTHPECQTCERDYNPAHFPNNLDCPRYKEMHVIISTGRMYKANLGDKE